MDPEQEAEVMHTAYYTNYGLALRGLVLNNHNVGKGLYLLNLGFELHVPIDPLDFDRKCDGSLPLKEMIKPDPSLIKLFNDIDRSKCRVWALTNAYITVRHVIK